MSILTFKRYSEITEIFRPANLRPGDGTAVMSLGCKSSREAKASRKILHFVFKINESNSLAFS